MAVEEFLAILSLRYLGEHFNKCGRDKLWHHCGIKTGSELSPLQAVRMKAKILFVTQTSEVKSTVGVYYMIA